MKRISATLLLVSFLANANGEEAHRATTETLELTPAGPVVKFTLDEYSRTRRLHDTDGDGWCDLWCSMFPDIEHRNEATDTDGDGLSDYQEMVLMRDPGRAAPLPHDATPEEISAAQQKAEVRLVKLQEDWTARLAEARRHGLREVIGRDRPDNDPRLAKRGAMLQALQQKAAQAGAEAAEKRRVLANEAAMLGLELENRQLDGTILRFMGQDNGTPIFTGSHNRVAAASISADELWPSSAAPWASGSTGLDLTGSGQTLATWENDGGVRTGHDAFGSRVNQRDNASLDTTGHATETTGTMAGAGTGNGAATGVAYEAHGGFFHRPKTLIVS